MTKQNNCPTDHAVRYVSQIAINQSSSTTNIFTPSI